MTEVFCFAPVFEHFIGGVLINIDFGYFKLCLICDLENGFGILAVILSETKSNIAGIYGIRTRLVRVIDGRLRTSKYSAGDYKVATGGSTLRFKKKPGRNTDVLASIPDGTAVAVLEVIEINETDDIYRYWGKISYNGHIGYVSMAYLAK